MSTTLKMITKSEKDTLIQYYMKGKIEKYIDIQSTFKETTMNTPYYEYAVNCVKKNTEGTKFSQLNIQRII